MALRKNLADKPSKSFPKMAVTMADLLVTTGYNIPSLRRGQEVSGKIIAISPQEILIDIGAKSEGIVFGRELESVRDLATKLSVGDQIDAMIVYPENDAGQMVLSLRKHSGEKRWQELEEKCKSGEELEVVAVEANRGGVICEYLGIRGFLPASQLSLGGPRGEAGGLDSELSQPSSKLNNLIGKTVSVRVIEVDRGTNRLIFSQRRPAKQDLENILKLLSKVAIGDKFEGKATAVLPFGVFVEIEIEEAEGTKGTKGSMGTKGTKEAKGSKVASSEPSVPPEPSAPSKLEGLVHISEISWEKVEDPSKLFKVGDQVEVMVIAKDETTGRLNLSIKQLARDPFLEISAKYSKDQSISGTIAKITSRGALIALEECVEGFVPVSKIPPNETWEIGQSVKCIVDSIDTKARRISLVPEVREKPVLYR